MPAKIVGFATRAQMLTRHRASEVRQMVLQLEGEAPRLVGQFLALIDRNTAAVEGWSFVMLSPMQNRLVMRWIDAHAKRPRVSTRLWPEFFCHMRTDTGEIVMDRAAMMEASGARSPEVSEALGELVSMGALIRQREGREVRFFMNPRVGTKLSGAAREEAQREAPPLLELIQGGAAPR
jgi:hypothetical protein